MTLHTPLWAQNAAYSARLDRQLIDAVFGPPHVVEGLAVSQRGDGANMSVDVAAGSVVMPGPLGNYLGVSDEVENLAIGAAPAAGTSRYDLIVARVYDPQAIGSGTDVEWKPEVVAGAASASPVEPSVPAWSTVLARITVTDSTVSISSSAIRDRRPLAGILASVGRTSDTSTASSTTVTLNSGSRSYFTLSEARTVEVSMYGDLMRTVNPGLARAKVLIDGDEAVRISTYLGVLGGPGTVTESSSRPRSLSAGEHQVTVELSSPTGGSHAWLLGSWRAWVKDIGPEYSWAE